MKISRITIFLFAILIAMTTMPGAVNAQDSTQATQQQATTQIRVKFVGRNSQYQSVSVVSVFDKRTGATIFPDGDGWMSVYPDVWYTAYFGKEYQYAGAYASWQKKNRVVFITVLRKP